MASKHTPILSKNMDISVKDYQYFRLDNLYIGLLTREKFQNLMQRKYRYGTFIWVEIVLRAFIEA